MVGGATEAKLSARYRGPSQPLSTPRFLRPASQGAGRWHSGFRTRACRRKLGTGYATEAARALLGFGFRDLRIDEVRSETVSANVRVVALARRLGLAEVGAHPGPAWMSARGW